VRSGYGRGYYGVGQLAQEAPRKKSWFTYVVVLGVGAAAVWFLWPRNKAAPDFGPVGKEPERPIPPTSVSEVSMQIAAPQAVPLAQLAPAQLPPGPPAAPTGAFLKQLEDDARARHFLTVKDYEDSVVRSAKQLQAAGAKVVLAPHLQHLAPQLES
jgi:hypothetical protein